MKAEHWYLYLIHQNASVSTYTISWDQHYIFLAWNVATAPTNTNLYGKKDYKLSLPRRIKRSDCPPKYTNLCDTWNVATTSKNTNLHETKDYKFGPPRTDKRCGSAFQADCIEGVCCSSHGWCGSTKAHCDCIGCYRFTEDVSSGQSQGKFSIDIF